MCQNEKSDRKGKRLRVIHICETARGGVGTYINSLLATDRFHQEVVIPYEHKGILTYPCKTHTYTRTGRNPSSLFRFLLTSISAVRSADFDVAFCHSSLSVLSVALLRLLRPRLPVVYSAHGWASTRETNNFTRYLTVRSEAMLAVLPTLNISVSEAEYKHTILNGFKGSHIIVENGVRSAHTGIRDERQNKADHLELVFVGRHDRQKGLDVLLDAFRLARRDRKDIFLQIVGTSVVDVQLSGHMETEGINYVGWVDDGEIDTVYKNADICVVPSRWEAFGLVVAEAYRNGCPVLVSDRGALPDMVIPGRTGYVFKHSVESLAEQLISLKKKDLAAMRSECEDLYKSRFTLSRMQKEIEDVYDDVSEKE